MTYCYFSHSIVALSWTVMLEMMSESGMIRTVLAYMDTFASLQQVLSIMRLLTLHIVMINPKLLNTNLLNSMEIVTSTWKARKHGKMRKTIVKVWEAHIWYPLLTGWSKLLYILEQNSQQLGWDWTINRYLTLSDTKFWSFLW